jgi:hypothetical protein
MAIHDRQAACIEVPRKERYLFRWQYADGRLFSEEILTEAPSVLGSDVVEKLYQKMIGIALHDGWTLLSWQKVEQIEVELPKIVCNQALGQQSQPMTVQENRYSALWLVKNG